MESSSGGNNGSGGGTKSSLSRKFTAGVATVSPKKGVQKFYTKIRHKIEDSMPPKISAKLNKNSTTGNSSSTTKTTSTTKNIKNSSTEQTRPTPPPRVSAANRKKKILNNSGGMSDSLTSSISLSSGNQSVVNNNVLKSPSYENVRISNNPNGLIESDEECRTNLNDSNLSLEDEIFEELEKVAHDEAKLNAVLKNFDKILADFSGSTNVMTTSTPTLKLCKDNRSNPMDNAPPTTPVATESKNIKTKSEVKTPNSHKPLQKSKTCSIIESRCILKKSISDSTQSDERNTEAISISNDLQHFAALQVTKSLWNLQDFDAFAKSGKKFDKLDCRLPMLKTSSSRYKLGKSLSSPETPSIGCRAKSMKQINKVSPIDTSSRLKSQLPRATSVWEVSSASLNNTHPLCTRTSSGSKIPVKKMIPQRLAYSGRSNSFCCNPMSNSSINISTSIPSQTSVILQKTNTTTTPTLTTTTTSAQKTIQVGKVLPTPKRSQGKITTVNKIVKNLNELSRSSSDISKTDLLIKRPGSTNSSGALSSLATIKSTATSTISTTNLTNKKQCRLINTASSTSTPHSLNKIGISVKASPSKSILSFTSTASSSSAAIIVSPKTTKTYLKSANSELSLNTIKSVRGLSSNKVNNLTAMTTTTTSKKNSQQSDLLLNKCLEKGQEILRKVEAFGSVTKLERSNNEYSKSGHHELQSPQQVRSKEIKNEISSPENNKTTITTTKITKTTSGMVTISTGQNQQQRNDNSKNKCIIAVTTKKEKDISLFNGVLKMEENKEYNLIATAAKKIPYSSDVDTVDGFCKSLPIDKLQQLCYAKECTIKFPRLESCKIIPPLLCHPSQQHAELLVPVKTTQQPLRVHQDSMLCINSDIIRSEKDYHSDCSEDSGHISNENDDLSTPISTDNDDKIIRNSTNNTNLDSTNNKSQKSLKISELLEKFESVKKDSSSSSSSSSAATTITPLSSSSSSHNQIDNNNCILKNKCTTIKVAEVKPVKCITSSMEIYPTYSSEVLFRSGILSQLEAKRDELLSDRIVQLQAYCRGYLARKRVAQRRVQELAVRCIQRNVKAFLAVRDWPWWRLLVRVTPLLNVHRTEEQLKTANEELQILKAKLEKIENDRNALKTENDKLEAKLSEMTVDLAEEKSTSNLISERFEAETAERLKLEKELQESQTKVKNLQETSEKLEMELICAKSDLNGISEDEDPDNEDSVGSGVYKLKYERVARELEFTKRRLQTQHEHDLEQLVGLKKQLEKKLADAYEEVEEQRQVVGQWKRKAQKMTNEMNDLRMLLEEQNGRNNILEKKQRKFDAECQALQDATRQERQAKDRLTREKDVLIAEKFTLEQNLADTRLELELKEEKLAALQRELEEMTFGGGTEEEMAQLKRSKMDLERRLKEQEEELDEMAGQVQLLEQTKLRLEMTLETMRKEARREAQQRDDELEEARGSAYKKIKALECQLENEHEERTLLLREKHELERRLQSAEEQDRADRAAEEVANQKLRRDIRKYKALLKDAHAQLERLKADSPGKALIRQLRNQLEDAETARSLAVKSRQSAEAELHEVQTMLDELQRSKSEAEEKAMAAHRDRTELQAQLEENEEELAELMKKYSATVKQLNNEQSAMSEYEIRISELESERNSLKEQVAELQQRLENIENMSDSSVAVQSKRLELRAKELESRLELEQATKARLEVQTSRHKDALEKVQNELAQSKIRELHAQESLKKVQKSLRELREEFHAVSNREQEGLAKRKDLEKRLETAEAESASLRNDLRLALQRIADLQQAMEEGDDDVTESDSDSTEASLSDLEQRLKPIQLKRTSVTSDFNTTKETNGGFEDTKLVIREKKSDNSPRITVTSPSSSSIAEHHKNGDTSFA